MDRSRRGSAIRLNFDTQEQLDAFLKTPYRYSKEVGIAPGKYTFRVALGSGEAGFGRVEKPLEVPAWNGQTLSVSGLAVSRDAHPLAGLMAGLDSSWLDGPRILATKGMAVVPMAATRFQQSDKGLFYFEVYEPGLAQPAQTAKPPIANMRVLVLDRATGRQIDDSGTMSAAGWMRPGNPAIPIGLGLPVATLSAGAYTLEVRVTRGNEQEAVVRTADFDVE